MRAQGGRRKAWRYALLMAVWWGRRDRRGDEDARGDVVQGGEAECVEGA